MTIEEIPSGKSLSRRLGAQYFFRIQANSLAPPAKYSDSL